MEQPSPGKALPVQSPNHATAWLALRAANRLAQRGLLPDHPCSYIADAVAGLRALPSGETHALMTWSPESGWALGDAAQGPSRELLDLYLPLLSSGRDKPLALGHLGQSLDGYIATDRGESCFVTGPENILHLHRLRALCDAVLVGAETVITDDPRLTTRLVPGENPVRVVLDPRLRVPAHRQVFQDGAAPTLLVCANGIKNPTRHGLAQVLTVPARAGRLGLSDLVQALHQRGLWRLFIEGGGVTVSAFLAAGLLDRLQVAVAPLVIGDGRRGLGLPAGEALGDCLRPPCRVFHMGDDILFDCEPRGQPRNADTVPDHSLYRVR